MKPLIRVLCLTALLPALAAPALGAPCFGDGSYELTNPISSNCVDLGTWTLDAWEITDTGGGTLEVTAPGTTVPTMTGTWDCGSGSFLATASVILSPSNCSMTYDLAGTFSGGDSFTGTFTMTTVGLICLGTLSSCGIGVWAPNTPIPTDGTLTGGGTDVPTFAEAGLRLVASPNPFRTSTDIRLALPDARKTHMTIHDAAGRLVATLVDGRTLAAGTRSLSWNGRDAQGTEVAPGVYFVHVRAGAERFSESIVRLR